ncbi:MAG: hypothetical protein PHZ09_12535 [Eubacteriales bacterium]|nr:hypothetical protein [Eubacteriales bacterium]
MRNKYEITLKRPIDKGWSGDGKFYIETASGDKMFMRTCDISEFERKKTEHEMTRRMYEAGVRVPRPLEYGVCDDGKNAFFCPGGLTAGTPSCSCRSWTQTRRRRRD